MSTPFELEEMNEEFLQRIEDSDLLNYCRVNSKIQTICNRDTFWKNRIMHRYPLLAKYLYLFKSWRILYENIIHNAYYLVRNSFMDNDDISADIFTSTQDAIDYIENKLSDNLGLDLIELLKIPQDERGELMGNMSYEIFIIFKDLLLNKPNEHLQSLYRIARPKVRSDFINPNILNYPTLPPFTKPLLYYNTRNNEYIPIGGALVSITIDNLRYTDRIRTDSEKLLYPNIDQTRSLTTFIFGKFAYSPLKNNTIFLIDMLLFDNTDEYIISLADGMYDDDDFFPEILLKIALKSKRLTIDDLDNM